MATRLVQIESATVIFGQKYGFPLDGAGKMDMLDRINASLTKHGVPEVDEDVMLWVVHRRRMLYLDNQRSMLPFFLPLEALGYNTS
jgi:hypothetical protein